MDISEIDKNFRIETKIKRAHLEFLDAEAEPFRIYGLLRENGRYCRMPEAVAESVSEYVHSLYGNTAGGRVRFVTDSPYVAISVTMDGICKMEHMTFAGSAGFDMYIDEGNGQTYYRSFIPSFHMDSGYESVADFPNRKKRMITINFPLYSNVKKLYIGLDSQSMRKEAPDYKYEKPIMYYGSSITQGGCASRPGNCYQNIISRRLDTNYRNLGFSDGARGETAMAEYIAEQEMSIFVCDYDHNAPDMETLKKTHLPLYRTVRAKQPRLPIVFVTAAEVLSAPNMKPPNVEPSVFSDRREVIRETYRTAVAEGDENVYFIDGAELFAGEDWDLCTVDGRHPNDLGFYRMARRMEQEIAPLL